MHYTITSNFEKELYHHGVLGMKWGIRRYQRKDGSLTPRGKKRLAEYNNDSTKNREWSKAKAEYKKVKQDVRSGKLSKDSKKYEEAKANLSDKRWMSVGRIAATQVLQPKARETMYGNLERGNTNVYKEAGKAYVKSVLTRYGGVTTATLVGAGLGTAVAPGVGTAAGAYAGYGAYALGNAAYLTNNTIRTAVAGRGKGVNSK